jgi:hypothetical protein
MMSLEIKEMLMGLHSLRSASDLNLMSSSRPRSNYFRGRRRSSLTSPSSPLAMRLLRVRKCHRLSELAQNWRQRWPNSREPARKSERFVFFKQEIWSNHVFAKAFLTKATRSCLPSSCFDNLIKHSPFDILKKRLREQTLFHGFRSF